MISMLTGSVPSGRIPKFDPSLNAQRSGLSSALRIRFVRHSGLGESLLSSALQINIVRQIREDLRNFLWKSGKNVPKSGESSDFSSEIGRIWFQELRAVASFSLVTMAQEEFRSINYNFSEFSNICDGLRGFGKSHCVHFLVTIWSKAEVFPDFHEKSYQTRAFVVEKLFEVWCKVSNLVSTELAAHVVAFGAHRVANRLGLFVHSVAALPFQIWGGWPQSVGRVWHAVWSGKCLKS